MGTLSTSDNNVKKLQPKEVDDEYKGVATDRKKAASAQLNRDLIHTEEMFSITGAWWPTLIFASKVEASDHETKLDFQGPSSSLAPSGSLFPMLFCDCMLFCLEVTPCPH